MQTGVQSITVVKSEANLFQVIRSILTDSLSTKLIALGDAVSGAAWQAGDLVNEIYEQVMAHRVEATIMQTCQFISYELNSEYSVSTLRVYSAVAKFYPWSIRATVNQIYPFAMFRFATKFGKDWQKVFNYADLFTDIHGRPPRVRELDEYFSPTSALLQDLQPATEYHATSEPLEAIAITGKLPDNACGDNNLQTELNQIIEFFSRMIRAEQSELRRTLISQLLCAARGLLET